MASGSNTPKKSQTAENEAFWKRLIQAWEKSDQSQADFCRRWSLSRHQFFYCKRKLFQNNRRFKKSQQMSDNGTPSGRCFFRMATFSLGV